MKKIFTLIAFAMPILVAAQSDIDALRYSRLMAGGTARSLGMSGAFGALGGDFGTLSFNPAGIGLYRSSEFVITPIIGNSETSSSFFGEKHTDYRYNFNIGNAGVVFNKLYYQDKNIERTSGWVSSSFAFGVNRLANYNSEVYFSGFNQYNSMLDRILETVNAGNGTQPSSLLSSYPFGAGLAYETYLIDPMQPDTMHYTSKIPDGNVQQSKGINTRGAFDEYVFTFGGNFSNKLYVGATLGLPSVRYRENATYTEEDVNELIGNFGSFEMHDYLRTTGTGVNMKLGVIWKAHDMIRIGGAVHTPTYMSLRDRYNTTYISDLEVDGNYEKSSPQGEFSYNLTTPWRIIGSAALVLKQYGLISIDYEWLDYGQAFYGFDDIQDFLLENQINQSIADKYGRSSNLRIGAEFRHKIFRLRGGYSTMSTPFREGIAAGDADESYRTISFGAGIRDKGYFVDLAYVNSKSRSFNVPYTLEDPLETVGGAVLDKRTGQVVCTVGFRF